MIDDYCQFAPMLRMTEDVQPDQAKPLTEEQIKIVNELQVGSGGFAQTEHFLIPTAELSQWVAKEPDDPVVVMLTKKDWDHLFFAFTQIVHASATLRHSVRQLSVNDLRGANALYSKSDELGRMAENNFRQFFSGIVTKAAK